MGGIYKDPKFWSEVRTFFGEAAFFGELQPMKAE
jgi:hypothetical protein